MCVLSCTANWPFVSEPSVPAVSSVVPPAGKPAGGTAVLITGTGFTGATAVKFGANNATGVIVNGATSISATSPAGTGLVDVTVIGPGGTSAVNAGDKFNYTTIPAVTNVTPKSGPKTGGTAVTLTGVNFTGAAPAPPS